MARRLPILVEHSLGDLEAKRADIASRFEASALATGGPLSCRSGCSNCCTHPITISVFEGILLYRHLVESGQWGRELKTKLQESADLHTGVMYEIWLLSASPCPLLDAEKKCSAYGARPLICRTYLAKSDPHYCHPHALGPATHILDRTLATTEFHVAEQRILKGHRLQHLLVPIGAAVLLAERICSGAVDVPKADKELIREYVEKA